jgi:bifunctional non-homologous end joining protein LigD
MTPRDPLTPYRDKRSPSRTPEPFGETVATGAGLFVVQKHAATRTHYDLRLELGGALKSWAVPKGISPDPVDKKLAVHVEDHPIEYAEFEGIIPEGEYGAGEMIVWDLGRWVPLEDPEEGLEAGKLLFELRGYKLRGVWTLVKLKKSDTGKDWLLIRERRGGHPILEDGSLPEESVLSGLTVEQLAHTRDGWDAAEETRAELAASGATKRQLDPTKVKLMLAKVRDDAFSDPEWLFELKLDGYRMLAARVSGEPLLLTRNGHDATASFPEIARVLRRLPFEHLVLDGEVVVHDDSGLPSFQRLQGRARLSRPLDVGRAAVERPASFYAFDLLGFEGYDLRRLPLTDRKRLLHPLLPPAGPLRHSEHFEEEGERLFEQVQGMGLEGIMAKRADSPYVGGRSASWLKVHAAQESCFAIIGYTQPKASRTGFGALHLGVYESQVGASEESDRSADRGRGSGADSDAPASLVYAGRVGTGFDEAQLGDLRRALDASVRDDPPFEGPGPSGREHAWVRPGLVARVRYKEWTDEGLLRQPVFLDLEEMPVEECRRPEHQRRVLHEPVQVQAGAPPVDEIPLSNLDKPFWPDDGYSKGDLIEYYRTISPWLLPFLEDRPLVLTRYPDGIHGKSFFQKNAPGFQPRWVRTETIWSEGSERDIDYFVAGDTASLVYLANLGTIPLHIWASRLSTLDRPDWCVLDLDPKEAPFTDVIRIALAIRELCEDIELPTFVKTSGSSGLHVLIPLGGQLDYQQSRSLGQLLANLVVSELPEIATTVRIPAQREGKVYIDFVQNGRGRLVVAPYSVRPLPGAPVSAPLRWREVKRGLKMEKYTIKTMPRRARALAEDPLAGLLESRPDLLGALEKLSAKLSRDGG